MKERIKKAYDFAVEKHGYQKYGDRPYIVHLQDVYDELVNHGITETKILVAAWLHDVIEDTSANYNEVKRKFSEGVAEIVYACTDDLGKDREERHGSNWPRLKENPEAVIVKQADLIANARACARDNAKRFQLYQDEYPAFRHYFQERLLGDERLWVTLDQILNV